MSLTDRIAALTPEQRALFEKLKDQQQKAKRVLGPPPIPRVSGPTGEGDWPLSLDQERFWFMEQLYPGGAGLNISAATRMRGRLSVPLLAAALGHVVRRHAAWRTTFPRVDGRPVQRVAPPLASRAQTLSVIDLTGLPAARREPHALGLVGEEVAAPFDLERGPLLRSSLVRVSAEDHLCLLTVHHTVTDFISFQIAWGELAVLYDALKAGRRPALPEPPVHYPDFAVWQRGWLTGEALDRLASWWRGRLAGFPRTLDLPTDRPRGAAPGLRGGRRFVLAGRALSTGLRALGREAGATLFMTILAATAALLHRLQAGAHAENAEKLILGANNANRNRPEIEPVLGCFLTQVPFPLDLAGDPTFRQLLARVRESALGAYAHQDLPFGQLIQAIELPRDPSRQPLVQALVQVLDGAPSPVQLGGLRFEAVDSYDGKARYDLMLTLFNDPEAPEGLGGSLEYDADLFDATTVERWVELFLLQAEAAVAEPEIRLSALPALAAAARHQALCEWSDTAAPLPAWTAPERFAAQAARTPAALAVVAGIAGRADEETLTYADLDRRADDLAHRLAAAGVIPESRVALLLDRTADLPVAIFAVWKAGGAYLPLDLATPAARLADLLADASPAVVVHRGALPEGLAAGIPAVDLAAPEPGDGERSAPPLSVPTRPDQLAYLIYTSGTTGRPKAVMVEHGNLAAVLGSFLDRYALGPGDRVPHLSRYTFDVSLLEIVAPLLAGGATEIVASDEILDPEKMQDVLARVTRVFAVPALLRPLAAGARERGPARFAGLRTITAGGDLVSPELQRDVLSAFPEAALDVLYGPTETTVICTAHPVSRTGSPDRAVHRALIGRPLPGVEARVVDSRGSPVALGVPGELWIGGPGVARGYFRREELSAERFVAVEGRRFYRSGDLVRQVPAAGGALEFLGRTDHQVKVRGFRIEPEEVEAALARHPAVGESVVVASPGIAGERQLVVYVVAAGETTPSIPLIAELREFLRTLLPEHLVPSIFIPLPALPRTSHGKVDRNALPAPETAGGATSAASSGGPRDAREEKLAAIWRQVLGRERVGIDDNFFQLGGDSILSIQVVARARQAGLLLTPRQLFEHQTIAALARIAGGAGSAGEALASDAGPVEGEAPLTPIQRRFFAAERREPWRFNQAVLLVSRPRLQAAPLAAALAGLGGHHDALRLRFVREAGGGQCWRQFHAPAGEATVPLLEIDLAALPRQARSGALEAAAEALQSGLDLGRGPLVTAALFRLGAMSEREGDRLLLTAHHLIVDGVSWRVLLEDLAAVYGRSATDLPLGLPPRTTSWKRWAELLAAHARSPELAAELPYWLALPPTVPELPVDFAGETESTAAATVTVELGEAETRALLQAAPKAYRTEVNDLLLAALARAFAGWSGEDRLLVDLEGHGREEIFPGVDLSRTVGWFTTLFPVALALPPGGGLGEAIRAVKERLRAVPRRGLGYGLLRYLAGVAGVAGEREGEPGERLAALPAPQVSFNYLGQLDATLGAAGLFSAAPEEVRGTMGEAVAGRHLFAVDALVLEGRLRVSWTYDPGRHLAVTAERLAAGFLAELRGLVEHCLSPQAGGVTPSDFPLVRIDQAGLDRLLAGRVSPREVEDLYPLTPLQEGILFHSVHKGGAEIYFEQLTAELDGRLDLPAFLRAWQRVVERHTALRTAFLWEEVEKPLQLVRRRAELPSTVEDWRDLPPQALAERFRERLAADRATGFDLTRPPLTRLALVRTGEARHRLVWSFHHLLLDGWCFALLLTEVFTLYTAFSARPARPEPPLPTSRPYRDYIAWLAGRDPAEAELYWRRALHGFTAPTPLPLDHPEAPAGSRADDFHERRVALPAPLAAALGGLAQRLRVTLNTVTQGAWALLLSRYSETTDVLFGAVVSGRPAELTGVETMVGLFINTLPVRVQVPEPSGEEITTAAWLARLQESQVELRQHQWSPLPRVQSLSEVPAGQPLFASLFVFENYPVDPVVGEQLGELRVGEVESVERTNYPLTLTAVAREEIVLRLIADRRFEPATTRRMLGHLSTLLAALAVDPERPPSKLPLLTTPERHQLTAEWNDTATRGFRTPETPGLHALFAEQAARRPDAVALRAATGYLSYGELGGRAHAVARDLARRGVRRGDLVGLCAERSAELVIALLAIVEAGAAYLPLDPAYPAARLERMLAEARAPLVLASPHFAERLPAGPAPIVALAAGSGAGSGGDAPGSEMNVEVGGDDLAYVLYTSGSTGTPKGVAVPQGAVARLVRETGYAAFGPDEVFLLMAPLTFDPSTLEIWGPLLHGGSLALLPSGEASIEGLERALREFAVTTLWLTAGLFHLVVDERPGALAPLRQLLAGGDVLSPPHVARLRRTLPGLRLINGYGPTENTTFTTAHTVTGAGEDDRRSVPIGRPIANTLAQVLGGDLEPVPIGVAGELYAGGAGLARGYLGRPDLTAASFVPAPACGAPGARLYRTGDLVRRLADGRLEFLGRRDQQVKLRGFRVEPGEIEAVLATHPAVREAAVLARRDGGEPRLVAYVVANGAAPETADLAAFLAGRLPAYMIPTAWVPLDALPLTANGKLDRAALPAPERPGQPAASWVAPASPLEELLAKTTEELLGSSRGGRVGMRDNFFALGGHSLLATQLVSRLTQEHGIEVTVQMVFDAPDLGTLADRIVERELSGADDDLLAAALAELAGTEGL